ncbi:MAG: hypothetical protein ACI4F4_04660, partial [Lachnospiraceae bacterium]
TESRKGMIKEKDFENEDYLRFVEARQTLINYFCKEQKNAKILDWLKNIAKLISEKNSFF